MDKDKSRTDLLAAGREKEYKEKPDYARCVAIVASASLREMIKPGALAIISPIAVGIAFRIFGYYLEAKDFAYNYLSGTTPKE